MKQTRTNYPGRDEQIYYARQHGKKRAEVAAEFCISVSAVDRAVNRYATRRRREHEDARLQTAINLLLSEGYVVTDQGEVVTSPRRKK